MHTRIPRSVQTVVALLALAVAQLPVSRLHADGNAPSAAAKEKGEKDNGQADKGEKDKGKKDDGEKDKGKKDEGGKDKGKKDDGEKGDKDNADNAAPEKEDEDDDGEKGDKGDKGEKVHKKSADEELFGPNEKDEADPIRLEVHAKGERVSARLKIGKLLEGKPMTEDLREELHRHAFMTAKLLRIRLLARSGKDATAITKVNLVLAKERTRHDEFLTNYKSKKAGAK